MPVLALRLTLLTGALLVGCGAADPSSQPHSTTAASTSAPRGDQFHGAITNATKRLAGERGDVSVVLSHPPRGSNASTSLTLSIRGASCSGQRHCLRLKGRLSGRMTQEHSLPDVGHKFEISAHGSITPLGQVKVTGTATGTGFIASGHTGLNLKLQSAYGTVTIDGQSGPVPGSTDP